MPSTFDIRLVGYIPGGARFTEGEAVIPTAGMDFVAPQDTATLQTSVSKVTYPNLPNRFEVALQYYDERVVGADKWVEGEKCRFLVNGDSYDDKDPAKMHSLSTVAEWEWFANKTELSGVVPLSLSGLSAEAAKTLTSVTSSGTTLTKTAHGLANGDQVRLTVVGATKPTGLTVNTVYWVRDVTTNTFKLAGTSDGSAKTIGTASGMTFVRLRTKIVAASTQLQNNDKVTISAIGGSDATFTVGDSFYVVRRTSTKFELSKSVGGDSIEIGTAGPLSMYRDTDGNRQFSAVTPGTILKTIIDEEQAKSPAWAPFLTYDFSNTVDSNGIAWPDLMTLQLKPGTTIAQVLQLMREQGWIDTATQGRTLRVFVPERGTDRTTGADQVRIGYKATSVPVKRSLDNLITHLRVRGEGAVELTLFNPAASMDLGRLSAYETLSGVLDTATATILGNQTLKKGGQEQTQYTVTEAVADAESLPLLHYKVGDWVWTWIDSQWMRLRVAEFVIRKDGNTLTVSTVLNDVFTDAVARLLRKRAAAVGGTISGGSGGGVDETDTRKPKAPIGLVTDTLGSWAADGSPVAAVTATWTPVTQATDSTSIDVDVYELWLRPDGSNTSNLATSTEDTTVAYGPLISGRTYYAKVRAKTRAGQYGEYSAEVEFTAAVPLEILEPPSAPVLTTEKGVVTVRWDGLIGSGNAPAHFRHVYVAQSNAEAGTYTPVGQDIGVPNGVSVITGLTIGQLYWFKLYPVDRLGIVGTGSTAASITVVGINAPDIEAGAVSANKIAAGAIQSYHINVGTEPPAGTPVNRVPAPLTDTSFWGQAMSDTIKGFVARGATSTTTGLLLAAGQSVSLTQNLLPAPSSGRLSANWVSDGISGVWARAINSAGATISDTPLTNGGVITLPATTVTYYVHAANFTATAKTISSASVFEVIGDQSGQQRVEISPSGLRLTNSDGSGYIDLTTNTAQYFSIQKETNAGSGIYNSVMSIDSDGNISGNSLSSGTTLEVGGTDVIGGMDTAALYEGSIGSLPLLERIGWGEIYTRTFTFPSSINTQFRSIASGYFTAVAGRQYEFIVHIGKVEYSNPTTENLRMELLVSSSPISVTDGSNTWVQTQFLIQNQNQMLPIPNLRAELKCIPTVTDQWSEIPPGTVYWMLRLHFANPIASSPPAISQAYDTGNRIISIRDMGPVRSTVSATNWATSGTQATMTSRRVDTFNATWSAAWSGATKIVGSTQFANARSLYNGTNGSGVVHSSAVGFPALGLSGRTVLKAEVWLKNGNSKYSSFEPDIGTASATTEPASPPTRGNGFYTRFYRGEGRWVSLPSATYAGIANGTIRAVTVGYLDYPDDYGYFDGFGQSSPPKLRITSEES